MQEAQFISQLPNQVLDATPSQRQEGPKSGRSHASSHLQLPGDAVSVSVSVSRGLPVTQTHSKSPANLSLHPTPHAPSPSHLQDHAIQTPPQGLAAARAEAVTGCCIGVRRRWNRKTTNQIIGLLRPNVLSNLLQLSTLVKNNPQAARFALERNLSKAEHAVLEVVSKPQITDTEIAAIHLIIQNVFSGKTIDRPTHGDPEKDVWNYVDVDKIFSASRDIIDTTVVTKAVVHGYELLRAFVPRGELEDKLRQEMVYRALLTMDQKRIQEFFGPGREEQWVYNFIKEKWQPESLASLSEFIAKDEQVNSLQRMQELPDSVLNQFKSS